MKNKNARLKEIAYDLNLSINTVSRALRDCKDISKATKEKVIQKAIEFGYMPNIISQSLKNDSVKCIAILINNFNNLYFISMYDKFAELCKKNNYDFTIIFSNEGEVSVDIIKQCISQRVDGIISFFDFSEESLNYARYNNIVSVFLGKSKREQQVSQVFTDDEVGGTLAANYLLNLYKIDTFIYIGYGKEIKNSLDRYLSFKNVISKRKPKAQIKYYKYNKNTCINDNDLQEFLTPNEIGVFAFNDEIAYDLISKLNTKVPNYQKLFPNFHIIGFDSSSTRVKGLMDIASIDFDYNLMSIEAMNILKEAFINKNFEIKKISIPTTLHQQIYL